MTARTANGAKSTYGTKLIFLVLVAFVFSCDAIAQQANDDAIEPLTAFLGNDHLAPVDYVLQLFDEHDVVVLCERIHSESTQWDLIFDLVSDQRFIDRVGNVFTEYGVVNLQPSLDTFMETGGLSESEVESNVVHIMRNLSIWAIWSHTNYYNFLKKLYALNQSLAEHERISLYFSDIPLEWEGMTREKYESIRQDVFPKRDRIMADRIERKFKGILNSDEKRKKCLVIMNYRHAFGPIRNPSGELLGNTAEFLFEAFPGKVANVLLNTVSFNLANELVPVQNGTWDSAFGQVGNPEAGFDFLDSPFGNDAFDLFPFQPWIVDTYKYQDVFTGFIFYKPLNEHVIQQGFPGLYDDFEETVLARARCIGEDYYRKMKLTVGLAQRREEPTRESVPPYVKR